MKDDQYEEFLELDNLEEGFLDFIFGKKQFSGTEKTIAYLEKLYGTLGGLKRNYPVHVRRIRNNIKSIIMDLEDLKTLMKMGKSEKSRFSDLK